MNKLINQNEYITKFNPKMNGNEEKFTIEQL